MPDYGIRMTKPLYTNYVSLGNCFTNQQQNTDTNLTTNRKHAVLNERSGTYI